MKQHITRSLLVTALAMVAIGLVDRSPAVATPLIVVVSASGPELDGPAALASYDLTFMFDVDLIVQSVAFGPELGGPALSLQDVDSTLPGALTLRELSFLLSLSAQPDAFVLATLQLEVPGGNLASAFASFHLDPGSPGFGDEIGNTLRLSLLQLSSPNLPAANPVPEPATLTLLGLGLAAVVARRVRISLK